MLKEWNLRTCGSCKKDIGKKTVIKVTIAGDSWYFCDWTCINEFSANCLNIEDSESGGIKNK